MALHIEPNGDRTRELTDYCDGCTSGCDSTHHYLCIADGVEQPGNPDFTDMVYASFNPPTDPLPKTDSFTMTTHNMDGGRAQNVTIWPFLVWESVARRIEVSLWNSDESSQYGATQSYEGIAIGGDAGWRSFVFSNVDLSQAEIDGLVVRLKIMEVL